MPKTYGFHYLSEDGDHLYRLITAGHQTVARESYCWNGLTRGGRGFIFQYTLQGAGRLRFGTEYYDVGMEQAFLVKVPSDHEYAISPEHGAEWEFLWVRFDGLGAEELWQEWMAKLGPVAGFSPESPSIVLLRQLYRDASAKQTGDRFDISLRIYEWMLTLLRMLAGKEVAAADKIPAPYRQAAAIMDQHFAEELTLTQIAGEVKLSPNHLCGIFPRYYGATPMEYLRNRRIENAARMLRENSLPIAQIAARCGYSNTSYFGKVFRKVLGLAPTSFREAGPEEIQDVLQLLE